MARDQRDIISSETPEGTAQFTVTNRTKARSLNCDANDDLLTADTLGTLIEDLVAIGIIKGAVS